MGLVELRLRHGARKKRKRHPWVFSNELSPPHKKTGMQAGSEVVVLDAEGRILGTGDYNPHTLISVRIHTWGRVAPLEAEELKKRIRKALALRTMWYPEGRSRCCRIVYGEADNLPGLIADRYENVLVLQLLTAGMEKRKETLLEIFEDLLAPSCVVIRNDVPYRELEGLKCGEVELHGADPGPMITELDGVKMALDPVRGQKTGFFLDQRDNYHLIKDWCPGTNVLDLFCYSGAWGIHAALWGAASVTMVDSSATALELAKKACETNGVSAELIKEDALSFLKQAENQGIRYDVMVLDPPPFARRKKDVKSALAGYYNLARRAAKLATPSGCVIVACSCSHSVDEEAFIRSTSQGIAAAGRQPLLLARGGQARDHPILPTMPESRYLKVLTYWVD